MAARYTDSDIQQLLAERKLLPDEYRKKLKLREKRGHREAELSIAGAAGVEFRLIAPQNSLNVLDFSLILAVCPAGSNQMFRLRRHNGKSHEHTNQIEASTSTTSTFTWPPNGIRNSECARMPTPKPQTVLGTLTARFAACWTMAGLRCRPTPISISSMRRRHEYSRH
jgi:hypothetical protein